MYLEEISFHEAIIRRQSITKARIGFWVPEKESQRIISIKDTDWET